MIHIATVRVVNPAVFWLAILGFGLFATAKIAVIRSGRWISFGTAPMSQRAANLYRLGYWLIIVGVLTTFAD